MFSPKEAPQNNILNSVLHDIIIATGSPVAQPPAIEEGWDEYTRTVTAHDNDNRTSDALGRTSSVVSDWEKSYGEASSQKSSTRVLSPSPKAEASRESEHDNAAKETSEEYPQGLQLALIILGVCLSVFIIALNRQIVSTAIPRITDQFRSYDDVGWYGSAYLLTACAFQPLYGRIFMSFHVKISYLVALVIFEMGSLVCGLAPNSEVLIIGRAIQGLGSAGIVTGSFVIIGHCVPLVKRPVYFAAVGLMFGVGAITGPIFGGIFTDLVTWRWCFYFNLPIGGATIAVLLFFFKAKEQPITRRPFLKRAAALDHMGTFILLGGFVMFFLALQYGEELAGWASAKVIGLLVGAVVTFILFAIWEWWKKDDALIPVRIATQRTVIASCISAIFIYGVLLTHCYYLPIWFQAIRGTTALRSGINMIPYMISNAFCTLSAGIVVSKTGYFTPAAIFGCAIATIGCGLLATLSVDISTAKWVGYEILASGGLGIAVQIGFTAVQTVVKPEEISIATSAIVACQSMGGAVFISVGNTILQNQLINGSKAGILAHFDVGEVIRAGATSFRTTIPQELLPAFLVLYNAALQKVFYLAVGSAGLAFLSTLPMEWNSVKEKKEKEEVPAADASEKVPPTDASDKV